MIHARPDYNRIQDPAGKIGDDEPVFLIRGQDKSGPSTLRFWADNNLAFGGDPELSRLAREQAIVMESWQQHHKAKAADLPKLTHVCGSQGFGTQPKDQRETYQVEKKTVWVAYTNTDCTEGRGAEVPFAICAFKTTALRLARKCYVQGTDGPVRPMELVNVAGEWRMLGKPVTVVGPSAEDVDAEMQAFARQIAPPPSESMEHRAIQLLNKHGICMTCGELYEHDYDTPYARCGCGTSEWYHFTPI